MRRCAEASADAADRDVEFSKAYFSDRAVLSAEFSVPTTYAVVSLIWHALFKTQILSS